MLDVVRDYPWPAEKDVVLRAGVCVTIFVLAWFVLLAPLLHSLSMLVLWVVPVKPELRSTLAKIESLLWSWHAADIMGASLALLAILGTHYLEVLGTAVELDSTLQQICQPLREVLGTRCMMVEISHA